MMNLVAAGACHTEAVCEHTGEVLSIAFCSHCEEMTEAQQAVGIQSGTKAANDVMTMRPYGVGRHCTR